MSVAELPKFKIDEDSEMTAEEQATALHFEMNSPGPPKDKLGRTIKFPAYRFMPYPTAMYRDWDERAKQQEVRRIAGKLLLDLSNPRDYDRAVYELPEYESKVVGVNDYDAKGELNQQLRDKNDEDHRIALGQGWADTPSGVKEAKDRQNKAIALQAAHLNYEDRNLGETARRERDLVDDASDQHVLEVTPHDVKRVKKETK